MRNSILRMNKIRLKRKMRVRKKLKGSVERPRMCIVKTNKHIQVQLVDDAQAVTLAATGTNSKEFKNTEHNKRNIASAQVLGKRIAEMAKEKNISEVIFDRGGFKYHGILAELANAAREAGLKF